MTELQAAGAAISSLKAAFDLSKAVLDVAGAVKVQGKVFELQREILAAQSSAMAAQQAQATLLAEIGALKQQVVEVKNWDREAQNYELKAIDTGAFAYMLKPGMENGQPPHWLCAHCFNNRQKSLLQTKGQVVTPQEGRSQYAKWACNACRGEVTVFYTRKPSAPWPPLEG